MIAKICKPLLPLAAWLLVLSFLQSCSKDDDDEAVKHVKVLYVDRGCGGTVLVILDAHRNFGASYGCIGTDCPTRAVWVQQSALSTDKLKNGAEYYVDMERIEQVGQPYCALYVAPPNVSVKLLKVY